LALIEDVIFFVSASLDLSTEVKGRSRCKSFLFSIVVARYPLTKNLKSLDYRIDALLVYCKDQNTFHNVTENTCYYSDSVILSDLSIFVYWLHRQTAVSIL